MRCLPFDSVEKYGKPLALAVERLPFTKRERVRENPSSRAVRINHRCQDRILYLAYDPDVPDIAAVGRRDDDHAGPDLLLGQLRLGLGEDFTHIGGAVSAADGLADSAANHLVYRKSASQPSMVCVWRIARNERFIALLGHREDAGADFG